MTMTRIGKMEGGVEEEEDALESVLDEIPGQVGWMNSYDYESQEVMWMSDVVVQDGGGSSGSGVLYDETGMHSFPPAGDEYLTQFGGYASVGGGGSVVGGHTLSVGGPGHGVRSSQMYVGGGGGDLSPSSVSVLGFGGMYDGRNMSGVLSDEEELCRYLNRMGVRDDGVEYVSEGKCKDVDFVGFRFPDDPYDKGVSMPNGVYEYGELKEWVWGLWWSSCCCFAERVFELWRSWCWRRDDDDDESCTA